MDSYKHLYIDPSKSFYSLQHATLSNRTNLLQPQVLEVRALEERDLVVVAITELQSKFLKGVYIGDCIGEREDTRS